MITTSVKFTVLASAGAIAAGATVTARLTRPDVDAGVVVPTPPVSGKTGANGQCTLALWPNSRGVNGSQYEIEVSDGPSVIHNFLITVPEQVGVVLAETIINQVPYPTVDAAQAALTAAQAAAAEAANASRLTIGTVTEGAAAATITGDAGAQVLNLVIPAAPDGGAGATNLAYTASPTGGTVTSDTGTDAILTLADATNAGLMAPAQHSKLASIAAGATAVTVDAAPTDGSGNAVSSNGVFDALAGKSDTSHNHSGTYDPTATRRER